MKSWFSFLMMCCALLLARPVLADEEKPLPPYYVPPDFQPQKVKPLELTPVPGRPIGLAIGGGILTAAGAGLVAIGGVILGQPHMEWHGLGASFALSALFLGGQMAIAGPIMLGIGAARVARHQSAQRPLLAALPQLALAPILSRQMYGLAVSGRF